MDPDMTFSRMMEPVMETAKLVATPNKDAVMVYGPIIERYKKLENIVVNTFYASSSKESWNYLLYQRQSYIFAFYN